MRYLFTALYVALCVGAPLGHANSLSGKINQFIVERGTPGLVLMVASSSRVLHHMAYGHADLERRIPMRKDHIFRIYSMTKPITAAAMMKLVEQGRLTLETPLHAVLPEFRKRPPIPMNLLLTHTAGFAYGGSWGSVTGWRYALVNPLDDDNTLQEMSEELAGLPLMHDPGKKWLYGMASDVQGAVIEKLTGKPLDEVLSEMVLKPLHMNDTGFFVDAGRVDRLVPVYGYDKDDKESHLEDDGDKFKRRPTLLSGGGGLVSTTEDYMRFAQMLLRPEAHAHVMKPSSIRAMMVNQLPPAVGRIPHEYYSNSGFGFGMGVKVADEKYLAKDSVFWAGLAGTIFWVDPKKDLAVVAMMQLEGARLGLEKRIVPWVYEWLAESGMQQNQNRKEQARVSQQ